MSVVLNDILTTPRGPLEIPEVTTVCQSIAKGLLHIHKNLKIAHGAISGETILLSIEEKCQQQCHFRIRLDPKRLRHARLGRIRLNQLAAANSGSPSPLQLK